MFKVGDKVVVVDPAGNINYQIGEILTIREIVPADYDYPAMLRCVGKPGVCSTTVSNRSRRSPWL